MVTSSYPKYPGDVTAPFIESIAAGLAQRGHSVDVVLPHHPQLRRPPDDPVRFFPYRYAPDRFSLWGYAQSMAADERVRGGVFLLAPLVAVALRGKGAVAVVRKMMGATFGSKAEPGTIRGDFAISDGFNLVHGSDSPEAAAKELEIFFGAEVVDWKPGDQEWVYDSSDGVR